MVRKFDYPDLTPIDKAVIGVLQKTYPGEPVMRWHGDVRGRKFITIATFADMPSAGLDTHVTIGLANKAILFDGEEFRNDKDKPIRFELACVSERRNAKMSLVLSSCAFCIMDDMVLPDTGVILRGACKHAFPRTRVPHAYFVLPDKKLLPLTRSRSKLMELRWSSIAPVSEKEALCIEEGEEEMINEALRIGDGAILGPDRKPIN